MARLDLLKIQVEKFAGGKRLCVGNDIATSWKKFDSLSYMIMQKLGSLRGIWAIRYEAKHQFIMDLIRKLKNFNDVTFLLASRNKLHMLKSLLQMINFSLSYY